MDKERGGRRQWLKRAVGNQTQSRCPFRAKITLRANGGRRKTVERTGVLEETYPSVFIVKLDQDQQTFKRVSYSYADILTETVEIMVTGDDNEMRITYIKS